MNNLLSTTFLLVTIIFTTSASAGWILETIDSGDAGSYSGLVVDLENKPCVAYYDDANADLKYASLDEDGRWQFFTIDSEGTVGLDCSLLIDQNNLPHIFYRESIGMASAHLKYASFDGTTWQISTIDDEGMSGVWSSAAMDASGNPHVSYMSSNDLKHAYYDGAAWQIETILDDFVQVGCTSLAIDADDHPHISYHDVTNGNLKYANYDGTEWLITTVASEGNVGLVNSLALDSLGNPHIAYFDVDLADLAYAKYDGSQWQISTVDSTGSVGCYCSLALDSMDNPSISYYDGTNSDLKFATWDGQRWQITAVDSEGVVGKNTSLVIDQNGFMHITYSDMTNKSLKHAWYYQLPDDAVKLISFGAFATNSQALKLVWEVQSEGTSFLGYNLYRHIVDSSAHLSTSESVGSAIGKLWERVNPQLINGNGSCVYLDDSVKVGFTYEYALEAVLVDGSKQRLGTTTGSSAHPAAAFRIITLYPQPAAVSLNCRLIAPAAGTIKLNLFDLAGRMVRKTEVEAEDAGAIETQLDVYDLAYGVYILWAAQGRLTATQKVVVAR